MQEIVQHTSAKNSSKLNKFLHSEVNQLVQHTIPGFRSVFAIHTHLCGVIITLTLL